MTTLITGATGFVGRYLVEALCARGDSIRALVLADEDTTWLEERGVGIFRGDVRQRETLIEPMFGVQTVFHLASIHGLWRPQQTYHAVNVSGTANVCQVALHAGVERVVHVSSWTVYGMGLGQPLHEELPLQPLSDAYTVTKAEADELVQTYIADKQLPAVIIRPGTMFGPGDRVNFGRMAARLQSGKAAIIGSGRNLLPFVYVTDVVEGLLLAAQTEEAVGKAYNLASDQPLSQKAFWEAIATEIGAQAPRLYIPYHPLYLMAYLAEQANKISGAKRQPLVTRLGVNQFGTENHILIDKARRELGYTPRVPLHKGIARTAKWYLEQHEGARDI
jgi:nucleoside-diphosphate-sugar epimerase